MIGLSSTVSCPPLSRPASLGRKLNGKPTRKGVYIKNGNKVTIK